MKRLAEGEQREKEGKNLTGISLSLMHFCETCGKGPFPVRSSLNKHIRLSVNCNKAAQKKWGSFATTIWDKDDNDIPGHLKEATNARTGLEDEELAPTGLEEEEFTYMPDITLEDDLREDVANYNRIESQEDDVPLAGPPIQPAEPECLRAAVKEGVDDEKSSATFIEEFPANRGAGAVWGEEVPFFEKLRLDQEENESSRWGPFEDQDEWELAKWLIQNVGQNQTDTFLNLNIVGFTFVLIFSPLISCHLIDAGTDKALLSKQT
jgi:hypothetical protein